MTTRAWLALATGLLLLQQAEVVAGARSASQILSLGCTSAPMRGVGGVGGEEGRDHFQIAGINRRFFLEEK